MPPLLCVTPEFVRDIYETLNERADASTLTAGVDLTEDPDLNVETVDGERLILREIRTDGIVTASLQGCRNFT